MHNNTKTWYVLDILGTVNAGPLLMHEVGSPPNLSI